MNEIIEVFGFEFMQRAVVAGVVVSSLAAVMGVLMVLKKASFFADAVAHASLTGVAIGVLVGVDPVVAAVIYAVLVAIVIPKKKTESLVPVDSFLGFLLPFSMGMGAILLSVTPGYKPELISFLFGNILAISRFELMIVMLFSVVVGIVFVVMRKQFLLVAFDEVQARVSGLRVKTVEAWFNVLLAITVVIGTKMVGIVLINGLLVIPAATTRLFARNVGQMFMGTPIVAMVMTVLGLWISVVTEMPTGPMIAVTAGMIFLMALGLKSLIIRLR